MMSRHRCHCENPPAIHTRPLVIARSAATWQSTPFLSFLFHKLKTKTWIATLLASLFPRNDRKGEAFDACRCLSSFFMASLPLSLLTTVVIARAKGPWQSRLCLLKSKRYGLPRHSLRSFLAMTVAGTGLPCRYAPCNIVLYPGTAIYAINVVKWLNHAVCL